MKKKSDLRTLITDRLARLVRLREIGAPHSIITYEQSMLATHRLGYVARGGLLTDNQTFRTIYVKSMKNRGMEPGKLS